MIPAMRGQFLRSAATLALGLLAGCESRKAPAPAPPSAAPAALAPAVLDSAHKLLQTRREDEAERLLTETVRQHPDNAALLNLLGAALVERSQFAAAEVRFRRAAELDSTLADPWARLGWLLYESQGKAVEAKQLLQRALAIDPDHERARYTLGLVYQREGVLDSAAMAFADLLARIPSAEAHRQLGLVYLRQGALEQATAALREAERWWPYDPQVLVGLGQAMARRGKADSARALLAKAERLRQEEEELRPLRAAAERYPDQPQPHFNLGVAYVRMGRTDLAQRQYWHAIEVAPSYGLAYQGLGSLALAAGDIERAEGLLRAAIARDSTLAAAHGNLGLIYYGTGRVAVAVERLEIAIRHAPEDARLRANAARAYLEFGRAAEAQQAALWALAGDPSLHEVRELLGDAHALAGELEQALGHWRQAAEATGGDSSLTAKIARAERALATGR